MTYLNIQNILLAEDDAVVRNLLKRVLERAGYVVDVAHDGVEAYERLTCSTNQRYELVMTDVQMPNMSGIDVYIEYRKSIIFDPYTRFLFLTAGFTDENMELIDRLGVPYLIKPITLSALTKAMASLESSKVFDKMNERMVARTERVDIETYVEQTNKIFINLERYAKTNDYHSTIKALHILKSSSAVVGATLMANRCEEIWRDFTRGEYKYSVAETLATIMSIYSKTMKDLLDR